MMGGKNGHSRCACDRKASYRAMQKSAPDAYEVGFLCRTCGRQWSETLTAREAHLISGRIQCVFGCGRWHRPSTNVCSRCGARDGSKAPCVGWYTGHNVVPEYEHDCPKAPKEGGHG